MIKLTFRFIILFAFVQLKYSEAKAWGMQGHRIVGEIANSYLNAKAKKEVQLILGNESIAMASNWPDFIKSDTGYKSFNVWHYVDISANLTFSPLLDSLNADTLPNAYNKIHFLVNQLKNKNLAQKEKLMYLRFLIHLVGDVHQPLHVSRKGDRGGNDLKVTWFGEPSNMHKIWDEELIDHQKLSYSEYVRSINFVTNNQKMNWQSDSIDKWFFESYQLSEQIHVDIKPNDKLGYNYNYKILETLNQQLLKGGVRLAGLLNEIFRL